MFAPSCLSVAVSYCGGPFAFPHRYFNRVKTGYKCNIFYPDLIDKSVSPTYYLEPADTPDFVIIRFHAGPPYEDCAFKIVNREWNFQKKHGFRCQFDRGILQLYFNLKLERYRR